MHANDTMSSDSNDYCDNDLYSGDTRARDVRKCSCAGRFARNIAQYCVTFG